MIEAPLPVLAPCVLRAKAYANALSALYFGQPVYLVGGALRDPDPRDIDLVIPIPEDVFLAMYGSEESDDFSKLAEAWEKPTPLWFRWARDCAKQSLEATLLCRRKVDFKTQPLPLFEGYAAYPRLRLDTPLFQDKPPLVKPDRGSPGYPS